jgi:hypothetical protein
MQQNRQSTTCSTAVDVAVLTQAPDKLVFVLPPPSPTPEHTHSPWPRGVAQRVVVPNGRWGCLTPHHGSQDGTPDPGHQTGWAWSGAAPHPPRGPHPRVPRGGHYPKPRGRQGGRDAAQTLLGDRVLGLLPPLGAATVHSRGRHVGRGHAGGPRGLWQAHPGPQGGVPPRAAPGARTGPPCPGGPGSSGLPGRPCGDGPAGTAGAAQGPGPGPGPGARPR